MVSSRSLSFSYDGLKKFSFPDIQCDTGESLLVLGESGMGKTTFLHLLAGFIRPSSGEINIAGQAISQLSQAALDKFRGQHIGMVFQRSHFVRSLDVAGNLQLAQLFARKGGKNSKKIISETLDRLNLGDRLSDYPFRMSVGEQQRIAIARAVVNQPKVILADEPTSALDDQNCQQVLELLEEQAEIAQASLIIVTHDNRLKDRIKNHVELK